MTVGFLLFLLVPLTTLLYFGFQQIENNLLIEYQAEARKLIQLTDRKLFKSRTLANALPGDAFNYYQQVYNPIRKKSQQVLSPLSRLDIVQLKKWQQIEGLVGYFQYNKQGDFNSPIWPYTLSSNSFVKGDLRVNNDQQLDQAELSPEFLIRKRTAEDILNITSQSAGVQKLLQGELKKRASLFHTISDVSDYFIFYRIVIVARERRLQGYVVNRKAHLSEIITDKLKGRRFDSSILLKLKDTKHISRAEHFFYQQSSDDEVEVTYPQNIDKRFQEQLIYKTRLLAPYNSYLVSISTSSLPMTPAMIYSSIFIMILIITILSACYGFYRLGVKQLILGEQRLNFVSSVSHELKTPLTSIRMYAQMLKEGTVLSEAYKQDYYEFIYSESERLTRLINNILQLSKLSHQQQSVQPEYIQLEVLKDLIRSKVLSIINKHNFQLNIVIELDNVEGILVLTELDAFAQVIINITDNAVKFFDQERISDPDRQKIDFIFKKHLKHKHLIQLEIRDYGEGITEDQENKIFDLFYRGGNELTRSTQGTGIGLALVNELILAQGGEIEVVRREPGLAMLLSFQIKLS